MEIPVVAVKESTFSPINRFSLHTKVVAHKVLTLAPEAGQQPTNIHVHLPNTVYLQHFICDPVLSFQ